MKYIYALILSMGLCANAQQTILNNCQMQSPTINGGMSVNGPISINGNAFQSTTPQFTNFVSGQFYTNFLPNAIRVSEVVTNMPSAVLGSCGTELWVSSSTNSAVLNAVSVTTLSTAIAGITTVQQWSLAGMIQSGGYYCFTNVSTGAGNSSVPRNNSGQYTICP